MIQTPVSTLAVAVPSLSEIESAFDLCAAKTLRNLPRIAASGRSWAFAIDGDYENWNEGFFEIGNWTTGFFTGMGLLAWMHTRDKAFLNAVEVMDSLYKRKVTEGAADTMHDLGFLYSPYAVALYNLTGENRYKELGLKAAEILAGRFISKGNYIRAWGRMDELGTKYDGLAIIDCMMNLPLLFWASATSGDPRFREIAEKHSETALQHFIREDGSVYHSFRFNPDGSPQGPDNFCGRAVESHWARGATWAMYGFALAYRHTGNEQYLETALHVSRKWVSLLDDEIVPVWDFRLLAGEEDLRDSSAAAIAACAIQELERLGADDEELSAAKDALISRLCMDDYLDSSVSVQGVLRKAEVGNGVGKARSAYTSWGDYFFMEALGGELGLKVTWW